MLINHLFISPCSVLFCTQQCHVLGAVVESGIHFRAARFVKQFACHSSQIWDRALQQQQQPCFSTARCHHHHLVHLGEYFHGDHFWKILAFSRRNLRLFTFFRIPPAHVSCNEWLHGLRKKLRLLRKRKMRRICIQKYVCARYFTHD